MKNILVRTDSSSFIGTGHIMRDLVFVKRYKNAKIIFACQNLSGNINNKILQSGYKLEVLNSNNVEELDSLIKKHNIDMVVIDHYEIDYEYEKKLKDLNKDLHLLVFDDTYEKHCCDSLLNHNPYGNELKYKNLVPKNCKLFCGEKYTLIRDEFKKEKKTFFKKTKKTKILIALGGSDYNNYSFEILKLLRKVKNIEVFVVTTNANKNIKSLEKLAFLNKNFKIIINCNYMAKLINQIDLAIVSPSTILYEIIFMEKKFLAVKTAPNQRYMYKYLKQKKQNILEKFEKNSFFYMFKKVLNG